MKRRKSPSFGFCGNFEKGIKTSFEINMHRQPK